MSRRRVNTLGPKEVTLLVLEAMHRLQEKGITSCSARDVLRTLSKRIPYIKVTAVLDRAANQGIVEESFDKFRLNRTIGNFLGILKGVTHLAVGTRGNKKTMRKKKLGLKEMPKVKKPKRRQKKPVCESCQKVRACKCQVGCGCKVTCKACKVERVNRPKSVIIRQKMIERERKRFEKQKEQNQQQDQKRMRSPSATHNSNQASCSGIGNQDDDMLCGFQTYCHCDV